MATATVQLFASYADLLGSRLTIPLNDVTRVSDLVADIRALPNGDLLPLIPRVALNHRFATMDELVSAEDEIALIPPVAGG